MISSVLNFIYLNNDNPPSELENNYLEWMRLHPRFTLKIWTIESIRSDLILSRIPGFIDAFDSAALFAIKSDLARLAIVFSYGGFYSDIKNFPMKNFLTNFLSSDDLILTEHPKTIKSHHNLICNAFLASKPNNKVLECALSISINNIISRKTLGGVTAISGAAPLREAVKICNYERVCVIPQSIAWFEKGALDSCMKRISLPQLNGLNMEHHWSRMSEDQFYVQRSNNENSVK